MNKREDRGLPERSDAERILSRFPALKILILGDFMLDQFMWGRVERISPEAPVPVVNIERETLSLGGAGNVVRNVRATGAEVFPVGVIGEDWAGERILELMGKEKIAAENLVKAARPTTQKTRIIAHQQQVVRVDREEQDLVAPAVERKLAELFLQVLDSVDGVIVSDYAKGTITPGLLAQILPAAKSKGKLVCLDPKVRYFSSYSPVTAITPNQAEASNLLGYSIHSDADLEEAAVRILKLIQCDALLITLGEKGMALVADGSMTLVPARAREVYDVTGAGDTVISILCLALAAGASPLDAVKLTNVAAGIVVGKVGTAAVTPHELLSAL